MFPLIFAGLSAVFGLLAGWLGAYLKVKGENLATKEDFREALKRVEQNTSLVEGIKASITRRLALDSELREAVRQFFVAAGGLIYSCCWLAWDCTTRKRVDEELIRNYDTEARELMPQIVAQLAVIGMLDRTIYDKLLPLANGVHTLDYKVGDAVALAEKDLESGLKQLKQQHLEGNKLVEKLRESASNLLNEDVVKTV